VYWCLIIASVQYLIAEQVIFDKDREGSGAEHKRYIPLVSMLSWYKTVIVCWPPSLQSRSVDEAE